MIPKMPTKSPKNTKKPTNFDVAPSVDSSAPSILRQLCAAGVRLEMKGDRLSASPATHLNDELRDLIRRHKNQLMDYLVEAHQSASALIDAAMRSCDHWGDSQTAREEMRQDVIQTPPHLRADLLEHFRQSYPKELGRKEKGASR
ncbi:MAG: hypothetical protein U1C47_02305 [Hydrogenophaga sp.]|nr:hypothetical protein [Hydrogenophaga sp.]